MSRAIPVFGMIANRLLTISRRLCASVAVPRERSVSTAINALPMLIGAEDRLLDDVGLRRVPTPSGHDIVGETGATVVVLARFYALHAIYDPEAPPSRQICRDQI